MTTAVGGGCCGWRARKVSAVAAVGGHSPLERRAAQALRSKPSRAKPMARAFRCSSSSKPGPALKRCGIPKGIVFPPPATDASSPGCMQWWLFDVACRHGGGRKGHTWGACKAHAKLCHHCDGRQQPRPESRPGPTHGVRHWWRAGWWQSWRLEWLKGMGVASRQCPLGRQRPLQWPEPPTGKWDGPRELGKHWDSVWAVGTSPCRSRQGVHRCGTSSLRLWPRAGSEQGHAGTRQNTRWSCGCRAGDLSHPAGVLGRGGPGFWASPMRIPRWGHPARAWHRCWWWQALRRCRADRRRRVRTPRQQQVPRNRRWPMFSWQRAVDGGWGKADAGRGVGRLQCWQVAGTTTTSWKAGVGEWGWAQRAGRSSSEVEVRVTVPCAPCGHPQGDPAPTEPVHQRS